jgi:hypothetical protein
MTGAIIEHSTPGVSTWSATCGDIGIAARVVRNSSIDASRLVRKPITLATSARLSACPFGSHANTRRDAELPTTSTISIVVIKVSTGSLHQFPLAITLPALLALPPRAVAIGDRGAGVLADQIRRTPEIFQIAAARYRGDRVTKS